MIHPTQTTTTTTTTAEELAVRSRQADEASLALRGGRLLTAEEIAAKVRASEEAPLVPFTDL